MNYGLPYKGSKNRIAKKILDILPAAPVLYDVFCGMLAMGLAIAIFREIVL